MNNLKTAEGFLITQTGDGYLCSCPAELPSYVVRHDSAENAMSLMQNVCSLMRGGPFHIPRVDVQEIYIERFSTIVYRLSCPGLFPGLYAYGSTLDDAKTALTSLIEAFFKKDYFQHPIALEKQYNGFTATCQTLLPGIFRNSVQAEIAYNEMARTITDHLIRQDLEQRVTAPIIVTGSFHSGTSALALLLIKNNICMGSNLNYAYDEVDVSTGVPGTGPFAGLSGLVELYYPHGQENISSTELTLLQDFFFRLVQPKISFPYWGFKSPIAVYLIPLLSRIFPAARFLHIVRDGRDVALSPHSELPNNAFRRLLYFDRTDVSEWDGIRLTPDLGKQLQSNRFDPPPTLDECRLLAYLWEKMSLLGSEYGRHMPDRYLQVRFENLCLDPERTVSGISEFIKIPLDSRVVEWRQDRVGKFKNPPAWASAPDFVSEIEKTCQGGLAAFGYTKST